MPTSRNETVPSAVPFVCAACQAGPFSQESFFKAKSDDDGNDEGYQYKTNLRSLTARGCNWCDLVRMATNTLPTELFPRDDDEEIDVRYQIIVQPAVDWMEVTNTLQIFINEHETMLYSISAESGTKAAEEIGVGSDSQQEESYVNWERVLASIDACGDHEHCLKAEETYLPTRVIDCSDPLKPRLVETHRKIKARYCALSYVWGGEQNQKTTTKNVSTYLREGFPTLPQTISDAILATHKLGIRYLWVDALCIIQDSNEDKGKELADMGRIYLDSYLTLSILSTFRANGGFLHDEHAPVELPFYTSTKSNNPECMWLKYCVVYPNPRRGFKTDDTPVYSPLDERAWCLQESTLSPRRLIFQIPYVDYECRSFSESLTKGALQSEGKVAHSMNNYILFPKQASSGDSSNIDELRDHWGSIVAGYTGCKITVPADKLVALAGVAEIFQSRFNDDYIAGLWRKRLLDDLMWRVFGPGCRPAEYRAPTWSWASVDGSITWYGKHMLEEVSTEYEAEIVTSQVTPKLKIHPLGEVLEAKITMKAKILPLMLDGTRCTFTERKKISENLGDTFGDWFPPNGTCLQSRSFSGTQILEDDSVEEKRIGVEFDSAEGTEQDRPMDFYVIVLRSGNSWGEIGQAGYRDEAWMRGILALRDDGKTEQYRRVTSLDIWHFKGSEWFEGVQAREVTLV